MQIRHLNGATLCPRGGRFVDGTASLLSRARLVCHVLVVETRRGLLLVDTGLGSADLREPGRLGRTWLRRISPRLEPETTIVAQLRRLGATPADVRDIVVTHLDKDHASGITDFPEATVHVHALEHEAATSVESTGAYGGRYVREHWAHGPKWRLFRDGGDRWFGFDGVRALDEGEPDVLLVPFRGHTRGHTAVAVRAGERWLVHAGDGYFFRGQVETPPRSPILMRVFQKGLDVDRAQRIANQERLRELVAERPDEIVPFCAHDAVEFERLAGTAAPPAFERADFGGAGLERAGRERDTGRSNVGARRGP
jgi:glyoxylase-like metal-dependent hydrolase (beta-lactamase superfamily II)